jgi:phosphatidylserine decarboxylase
MLEMMLIGGAAALGLFLLFGLYTLRDPERDIPEGDNIVSPADGRIVAIVDLKDETLKIEKSMREKIDATALDVRNSRYLVLIRMTALGVKALRAPINGRIASVKNIRGRFRRADSLGSIENERTEILFNDLDQVKVLQIAGFLSRNTDCSVRKGDKIVKGERIGRNGSMVLLIIPKNVIIRAKERSQVIAGESVIADFG